VALDYRGDGVRLTVTNPLAGNGPGAAVAGPGALRTADAGYGLTGMRERLLLLSGTLEAGQRDGQWVVVADLPLTPAPTAAALADDGPQATGSSTAVRATREGSR
jgi:signal transduction histidine kinase